MKILCLILSITIIVTMQSCNSQQEKNTDSKATIDNVKIETGQLAVIENEPDTIEEISVYNEQDSNKYQLFNDLDWKITPSYDSSTIIIGVNEAFIAYAIINYINEKHLDPLREEKNPKDSISIDLAAQTFIYFRTSPSDLTEYDVRRNGIEFSHRLYWADEDHMTDKEIENWKREHQRMLDGVDSSLIRIKRYDRFVLKGNWDYVELNNDSLKLYLHYHSRLVDPTEYHRYGENIPWYTEEIHDNINMDLFKICYDLGRLSKYTQSYLSIIDLEHLSFVRNQFYARKGYKFRTNRMQRFFKIQTWYLATTDDVSNQLNKYEVYNIQLIKDVENQIK